MLHILISSQHIFGTWMHSQKQKRYFDKIFVTSCTGSCQMTTSSAASDENLVQIMTFPLACAWVIVFTPTPTQSHTLHNGSIGHCNMIWDNSTERLEMVSIGHNQVNYPRPVLAFGYCWCLHMCVWSLACLHDNSWPVQVKITKFGSDVYNPG